MPGSSRIDTSRDEVLLTDLPRHVIDGDVPPQRRSGQWMAVDYQLEQLGEGLALVGDADQRPPLTIRLGMSGHYRISFVTRYSTVRARLSGERCFRPCPSAEGRQWYGLVRSFDAEETIWREVDLTDQDLVLDGRDETTVLAIRLTPVLPATGKAEVRWPMAITNDANDMHVRPHLGPQDVLEESAMTEDDSCVRLMVYGDVHGDNCSHFTNVGTEAGALVDDAEWPQGARNLDRYRQWGINPAKALIDYAHQRGWRFYFYVRSRSFSDAWPADPAFQSKFYRDHPEFRLADRDGTPVLGLSIAYPQVREHLCNLYAELANLGADGVGPCFLRSVPIVLYEPAMVESFQRDHGLDPRDLPEDDPRWLDHTAGVVTAFMRQLNDAIGSRCRLAPFVHGTESLNRRYGMDVATWVADRIVADLFICGHTYDRHGLHRESGPEDLDFAYFNRLPGRQHVHLWPMFYMWKNWHADPRRHCEAFWSYMDAGADGYCLWDAGRRRSDLAGNFQDWGKWPRPPFQQGSRLLGKYEIRRWDGYTMNRHTQLESH